MAHWILTAVWTRFDFSDTLVVWLISRSCFCVRHMSYWIVTVCCFVPLGIMGKILQSLCRSLTTHCRRAELFVCFGFLSERGSCDSPMLRDCFDDWARVSLRDSAIQWKTDLLAVLSVDWRTEFGVWLGVHVWTQRIQLELKVRFLMLLHELKVAVFAKLQRENNLEPSRNAMHQHPMASVCVMCVCVCAFTHICSHVCVSTIPACKLVWTGHCIKKSITFMCCYSIKQLTLFCTKSLKLRGTVMAPALRIEGWNNKHKLWSICLRTGVFSKCWYAFEHGHMDCNMHEELLWEQTDRDVTVKCLIMSSRF